MSLVQPPQIVLVLRLRDDATNAGRGDQLTQELTRQQARGEEVYELLCKIVADRHEFETRIDARVEKDIAEFEENWRQWDALRQVLQTLQQPDDTPGMLAGLEKILHQPPDDTRDFQKLLLRELDNLIADLERLQAQSQNPTQAQMIQYQVFQGSPGSGTLVAQSSLDFAPVVSFTPVTGDYYIEVLSSEIAKSGRLSRFANS